MPILGTAAVAMWWTIEPAHLAEFGDWHAHEHFPERLGIPGFRRGSRWSGVENPGRHFVMYELDSYGVLTSPAYRARLDNPTPWSTKMMPHHLGMMRSQCRAAASHGSGIAGFLSTVRLSPAKGAATSLAGGLKDILASLPNQAGFTGAHLLVTQNPDADSLTTEQKIRGGDTTADWIVLVSGYDPLAVREGVETLLGATTLVSLGADDQVAAEHFRLAFSLTSSER